MRHLISVVIPIYNMADSLESSIKSLCNQTYTNLEIILVDDGSTDNSFDICYNLKSVDKRISVYHTENQGAGPARNYGIQMAHGDYIYFPDADDYIECDALETCVAATERGEYDLIVFGFKILTRKGRVISVKKFENYTVTGEDARNSYSKHFSFTAEFSIQGAPWNKLFSARIIKDNKIYFPPLRRHQDEGFISRYMCYAQNIRFIDKEFYYYYENDINNQWKKFPVDYIDAVIGLYDIRKKTICLWNEKDIETHNLVEAEYLSKIVTAVELAYSDKFHFNKRERLNYAKKVLSSVNLTEHYAANALNYYYRKIISLLVKNKISSALRLIKLKLFLKKYGVLRLRRRKK